MDKPTTRRGVTYWPTPQAAQEAAKGSPPRPRGQFGGPESPGPLLRSYGHGWALQAHDSGPYLGPDGWT